FASGDVIALRPPADDAAFHYTGDPRASVRAAFSFDRQGRPLMCDTAGVVRCRSLLTSHVICSCGLPAYRGLLAVHVERRHENTNRFSVLVIIDPCYGSVTSCEDQAVTFR